MNRRRFLALTGASTLVATAGCSQLTGDDDSSGGGDDQTDSPGAVVETFYELSNTIGADTEPSEALSQSGEGVEEGQEETTQQHLTATEGGAWLLII